MGCLRDVLVDVAMTPVRLARALTGKACEEVVTPLHTSGRWTMFPLTSKKAGCSALWDATARAKAPCLKSFRVSPSRPRVQCHVRGRVGSLLEVGTGFHPELTGRENIYMNGAILGMKRAEIESKFDEIVAFSEVEQFIDTPVKRYSSGMYLRLAFAVAAHLEPEILVVDEVLAVGDAEFQKKCLGKMGDVAQQGRTVLFVSHNMSAILAPDPGSHCPAARAS